MLAIIENKWDVKYIQILPGATGDVMENIGEDLYYQENYSM